MLKKKIILAVGLVSGFFLLIFFVISGDVPVEPEPAPSEPVVSLPEPDPPAPVRETENEPEPEPVKAEPVKKNVEKVAETAPPPAVEEADPPHQTIEEEYEQNRFFETLVKGSFPVHTIQTHNPLDTDVPGPPKDEIWVRIKPENAGEMNEIMSELADLYRDISAGYQEDVVVMHWVGAQPYARKTYSPDGSIR